MPRLLSRAEVSALVGRSRPKLLSRAQTKALVVGYRFKEFNQDQPRNAEGEFGSGGTASAAQSFQITERDPDGVVREGTGTAAARQAAADRGSKGLQRTGFRPPLQSGQSLPGNLTDAQREAVDSYRDWGSKTVNDALRAGGTDPRVRALDSAINKQTTTRPIAVFRGAGTALAGLQPGDTFTDKGYVSTSLMENIGRGFGRQEARQNYVAAQIEIPTGAHAMPMTAEREVLLPRNSTFRVTGVEQHPIVWPEPYGRKGTYTVVHMALVLP